MKNLVSSFYAKPLALYLVLALIALSSIAAPAQAMLIPVSPDAQQAHAGMDRAENLAAVQKTLESKVLQQRLMEYGLTPEETAERINALSDEQLHLLAANLDSLQPGGSVVGTLLTLALIAGIVVLIIFILQGRIAIERK